VPSAYTVVGSGNDSHQAQGDKDRVEFKFERHSFPGSIAVVKGPPANIQSEGVAALSISWPGSGNGAGVRR